MESSLSRTLRLQLRRSTRVPRARGGRAHGGGQKGAVGRQQKAEGQGGSPPSTVWTRVRGEKTCTFRINIVPRSHKEKGRSSRVVWRGAGAEDRTRIRGRTSSLSSVVAVVDFTASEGAALLSSRTIVVSLPFLLHVLSPLPPSTSSSSSSLSSVTGPQRRALSRKRRHFNTTHAAVGDNTYPSLARRPVIRECLARDAPKRVFARSAKYRSHDSTDVKSAEPNLRLARCRREVTEEITE